MTPNESLDEKIFDMHMAGFDDSYTYLDFYPAQRTDGTPLKASNAEGNVWPGQCSPAFEARANAPVGLRQC